MFYIGSKSTAIGDKVYVFGDVVKGISEDTMKILEKRKMVSSKKPKVVNSREMALKSLTETKKVDSAKMTEMQKEIDVLKSENASYKEKAMKLEVEIENLKIENADSKKALKKSLTENKKVENETKK